MPDIALNFMNFVTERFFQFGIILLIGTCWWKKRKKLERNKKNIVLALYAWIVDCKLILDRYCLEENIYCSKVEDVVFKEVFTVAPSELPIIDVTIGDNEIANNLLVLKQKYGHFKDTIGQPTSTAEAVDGSLVAAIHPYGIRDYFLAMRELMNSAYKISEAINKNSHLGIDLKIIDDIIENLNKIHL